MRQFDAFPAGQLYRIGGKQSGGTDRRGEPVSSHYLQPSQGLSSCSVVERINRKVLEWAALSRLRSFMSQREIKDGIDRLQHDIDAAIGKFNVRFPGFKSI